MKVIATGCVRADDRFARRIEHGAEAFPLAQAQLRSAGVPRLHPGTCRPAGAFAMSPSRPERLSTDTWRISPVGRTTRWSISGRDSRFDRLLQPTFDTLDVVRMNQPSKRARHPARHGWMPKSLKAPESHHGLACVGVEFPQPDIGGSAQRVACAATIARTSSSALLLPGDVGMSADHAGWAARRIALDHFPAIQIQIHRPSLWRIRNSHSKNSKVAGRIVPARSPG